MSYVSNIFSSFLNSSRILECISAEVISFEGDSYTVEVESRSLDEAPEMRIA